MAQTRRYREEAKEADAEGYYAQKRKQSKKYRDAHPGQGMEGNKRHNAKQFKEKKHYCHVCDHAFAAELHLTRHLAGPKHASKVAQKQEGIKNFDLYCAVCDQSFSRKQKLAQHLAGPRHAAKAARLNDDVVSQQN